MAPWSGIEIRPESGPKHEKARPNSTVTWITHFGGSSPARPDHRAQILGQPIPRILDRVGSVHSAGLSYPCPAIVGGVTAHPNHQTTGWFATPMFRTHKCVHMRLFAHTNKHMLPFTSEWTRALHDQYKCSHIMVIIFKHLSSVPNIICRLWS
jgi:hypothetical protein